MATFFSMLIYIMESSLTITTTAKAPTTNSDVVSRGTSYSIAFIVAVSFIGGVNRKNRRKPPTCRKENEREKKYDGTNVEVHVQPNQTSNGGCMLLQHGEHIHIDNYDISNMHHNKPVDHQHLITSEYQYACQPPSCTSAWNIAEPVGYEKCTYGTFYYYCDTGSCCKIDGVWQCTSIDLSISECNSLYETTTTTTTEASTTGGIYLTTKAKAPTTNYDVVSCGTSYSIEMILVIAGVGFVGLVFICLLVLCIKRNRRKNNCPSNSLPNTTGSQPLGKTQHIYYVPGTNAGVHTQPNQSSNRGHMLLQHGQQIHIANYDMSKMHHYKPIDHQHQMTGEYQYPCPPPSYEHALNSSEPLVNASDYSASQLLFDKK